MSQSQRLPVGEGPVRRAREAGSSLQMPPQTQSPPQRRAFDAPQPAQNASPGRPKLPMPAAFSAPRGRGGQGIGMAISRPTQVPQWPLAAPGSGNLTQENSDQPPSGRGQAPQRPPRPRHVPSMLDASKLQEHTPTFQYRPPPSNIQQQVPPPREPEDDNIVSPIASASRPSTVSSVGSIPDFPLPMPGPPGPPGPPASARRSANLGPPPTSRRGASSYYSNLSLVSPILEESPRTRPSHESYASSATIPSEWRDDKSDFNDDYDETHESNMFPNDTIIEESGRESRESNGDDNEERDLVRSASIGRRGKPLMVTTKSSEKAPAAADTTPLMNNKLARMGVFGPMEMRAAEMRAAAAAHANAAKGRPSPTSVQSGQRETVWPNVGNQDSPLAGSTGYIENSSSTDSSTSIPKAITTKDTSAAPTYSTTAVDPRISQILLAHKAASNTGEDQSEIPPELERSFSRLSVIRRPPKLNIDAVRDAEARGSLTSLPELIRRATKLAAMIDKGKRPGSRLNDLNDFPSDIDLTREKEEEAGIKRQSGLSGMLAAFPPPGDQTPRDDVSPRPPSWPSPFFGSPDALTRTNDGPKPRRRCCGLPIWGFLLIILITLCIITASVLVPLFLLVFNQQGKTTPSTPATAQCQQNNTCANGGTTILASSLCSCICANGFTGSTCTVPSATGCTTTNINGSNGTAYSNVTLGEAIPRLITQAKANFSIPLSSDLILARFNAANLSCNAENALVTFDGMNNRVGSALSPASSSIPATTDLPVRRDGDAGVSHSTSSTFSTSISVSPSIVYDTSTAPTASASASRTSSASSPTSTASFVVTQETLDFARVAVLFVLQEQELDDAVTAQYNMQSFFTETFNGQFSGQAGNVTLGNGNSVDFFNLSVDLGEGIVGGSANLGHGNKRWIGMGKVGVTVPVEPGGEYRWPGV